MDDNMNYNKYLKSNSQDDYSDAIALIECIVFIEACIDNTLNEGVVDSSKAFLSKIGDIFKNKVEPVAKKAGLHIETKKGLLQYLSSATTSVAKLLYYAVDYYFNKNEESKKKMIELAKSVKKEDIIDFLLKLDMLTLHLISGPIHQLDALTGTHIWANIQSKTKNVTDAAKDAIKKIESLKDHLEGSLKSQLQKYSNALRRLFGIGDFKNVSEGLLRDETIGSDIAEPDIKIGDTVQRRLKKKKGGCKRRRRRSITGKSKKCDYLDIE
jgi:vesicle coat complex subunit